jgi:biotin/methionine sulfoxide reductase
MTQPDDTTVMHSSHWGAFSAQVAGGRLQALRPFAGDPDPAALLGNFLGAGTERARVLHPAVRRGWLERRPGERAHAALRGRDEYVQVSWDQALDLLAEELRRIYREHGAQAVYGGSYGWASAGRFHHAQSQIHRFLNSLGGYTGSINTYSHGASALVFPHMLGLAVEELYRESTDWRVIATHTRLFVAFGGIPLKNAGVCGGGTGEHLVPAQLRAAHAQGTRFVLVSPQRDDMPDWLDADWLPIEPGTDAALMLALAHVLDAEGLADRDFLQRYCVGHDDWLGYVRGAVDGIPKTPQWAAAITGLPAERIAALARSMAGQRTMLSTAWALQRSWYGEQPVWASIALAALLGQIGLPGGGVGHGYGMTSSTGQPYVARMPFLPQGHNPVDSAIPVARVADMLLGPGTQYEFNGKRLRYPDIRMVYWCGGNPFHHHQDLHRLRDAFTMPDTVVVHEPFWTATARHADIVLPATITLERNDIAGSSNARHLFAMQQALPPAGEARDDYAIFSALAERLQCGAAFTEGRDERAWLEHLYESWRQDLPAACGTPPPFAQFWRQGMIELQPERAAPRIFLSDFRADPQQHPLRTPSGRIEVGSDLVRGFDYDDCPGYAVWREPPEWSGAAAASRYPLALLANNPATRLHSQFDAGAYSAAAKVAGREAIRMHPRDAAARGIADGDVVRVYNERGSLLAGARLYDGLKPGVVQLSTGAWLDWQSLAPDPAGRSETCVHGNPNVLTADCGTSRLAQGCVGQLSLVQLERHVGDAPAQRAWQAPALLRRSKSAG